jgi:AraC-like DNA-binding protein
MTTPTSPDPLVALHRNRLFRSDERVEAHDHVSRELIDHALHWKRGKPDAAMFKGELNQLRMYLLQYGAEVEVRPRPFDDFVLVHTSLSGGAEIEVDGQRLEVSEGRTAVLAPLRRVRLRWYPGTRQLIVKVPHALIRQLAEREVDQTVPLAPGFLIAREHALHWDLVSRSVLQAMTLPREGGGHAAWLDHFERNVALFLLTHQPGGSLLPPPRGAGADGVVPADAAAAPPAPRQRIDALVDYIDARLSAPVALEDLARATGVSLRSLNELCHRHHGVSPMELLRCRRLDAARAVLRMNPGASITETALTYGFGHLGRFSQYYHERFGELPSQTKAHGAS